jgi:hypothetical protein
LGVVLLVLVVEGEVLREEIEEAEGVEGVELLEAVEVFVRCRFGT